MKNQECKVIPQIVNVNWDDLACFLFSIKRSKCSGRCNSFNNPYAKLCVPDVVKKLNVKVFNLMTRTNKQDTQNNMKRVTVNVDQMAVFVIANNAGMKMNVNVKN